MELYHSTMNDSITQSLMVSDLNDPAMETLDCSGYRNNLPVLIRDVCNDRHRAVSCLFKQLHAYMLGTMKRQFFWRKSQAHLVKEAFLDAFMVLIRKIQTGKFVMDKGASIESYFYAVYQLTLKKLRYKSKIDVQKIMAYSMDDDKDLDQEQYVSYEVDRIHLFQQALEQLKEECRHLIDMRIYKELSYKEISATDNQSRSEGALKMKYSRCLKTLKNKLLS